MVLRRFRLFAVLFAALFIGISFVVFVQHASADIDHLFLGPNNGSSDLKLGVWTTGPNITLDSPQSRFRVFAPGVGSNDDDGFCININFTTDIPACSDQSKNDPQSKVQITVKGICSTGAKITITILDFNGNPKDVAKTPRDCNGGDIKFEMNTKLFHKLTYTSDWGYAVFTVRVDPISQSDVAQHFNIATSTYARVTFDDLGVGDPSTVNSSLRRPDGTDNACTNPTKPASSNKEIRDNQKNCRYPDDNAFSVIPENGSNDTFRLKFAPSCDYNGSSPVYLKWFDGDHGTAYGGNASFTLTDVTATPNQQIAEVHGNDIGGEGSFAYVNVGALKKDHHYVWEWTGINSSNGVQIWVPFSEFNTVYSCKDWSLSSDTKVSQHNVEDGDSVTFRHSVTNKQSSQSPAKYHWKVQYNWKGQGWKDNDPSHDKTDNDHNAVGPNNLPNGDANSIDPGKSSPTLNGDAVNNYKFPADAHDNDTYCQRIWYENANGPGSGAGTSQEECVTLDKGCQGSSCDENNQCKKGSIHIEAGYSPNGNNEQKTRVHITSEDAIDDDTGQLLDKWADMDGKTDGFHDKDWKITPKGRVIHIVIDQQWYKEDSPNKGWHNPGPNENPAPSNLRHVSTNTRTITCFDSTCEVLGVTAGTIPGAPSNAIKPDSDYKLLVRVYNTIPASSDNGLDMVTNHRGNTLYLNRNGTNYVAPISRVNKGSYKDVEITLHSPSGVHSETVYLSAIYGGGSDPFRLNGNPYYGCPYTIKTYQRFDISVNAQTPTASPSRENPSTIHYVTTVTNDEYENITVHVPTHSKFYKVPYGGTREDQPGAEGGNYPKGTSKEYDNDYSVTGPVSAGDQYCVTITAEYASGYIGPDGPNDVILTAGSDSSGPNCIKVANEPYVHFQGSDVSAGGGFGSSCDSNESKGTIYTYNNADSGKGGSGTQFGAQAYAIISGLGSANLRDPSPGVSIFNFANTNTSGSGSSRTTGGNLGGDSSFCVPNYFDDKPTSLSTYDPATTATVGSGNNQQYYRPGGTGSGTLTINPDNDTVLPNGVNQAIFVEGDVNIRHNITYTSSPRGSVNQIPSFYLIVKGNIHIDPSVTQLDGVYVAQPTGSNPTEGVINTCWSATDPIQVTDPAGLSTTYARCKNQLVVNGAFVANKLLLTRSHSSLRYSRPGEHTLGLFATQSCGLSGKDVPSGGSTKEDCAAEIFNFSPELYMSQPAINAKSSNKYDAITSLSPVL